MKKSQNNLITYVLVIMTVCCMTFGFNSCKPEKQPVHITILYDTVSFTPSAEANFLYLISDREEPCEVFFDSYPDWAIPYEPSIWVWSLYNSEQTIVFHPEGLSHGEHFAQLTFHTEYESYSATLVALMYELEEFQVPERIVFPSGTDEVTLTFYNPTSTDLIFSIFTDSYCWPISQYDYDGFIKPGETKQIGMRINREEFTPEYNILNLGIGFENFDIEIVVEE